MTPTEFKDAVAVACESSCPEIELDTLCFEWLETALESNGREGRTGLRLLQIIQEEYMP